jgi:hypothetical protein
MHWPRPVPVVWWKADYADIRERVRRTGRLDVEALWEPTSDDSWKAFRSRHGDYNFEWDWKKTDEIERERKAKARLRQQGLVRDIQESWEAEQRRRQQAKQARGDQEWHDAAVARAY